MAMSAGAVSVVEAVKERVSPALDKLDETIPQGRRVTVRGQHGAEDAAVVGFGLGWVTRGRK
jgi:hypothetical protein